MTVKSGTRKEAEKMPRSRPWIVALSAIALLFGLAAGPLLGDARAQDQVELRVWDQFTDPTESRNADAIYAAFTEQNPNITITREAFSSDQMRQTVNTAIASGTGPDIIFYDAGPGYAGVLANAGLLVAARRLCRAVRLEGADRRASPRGDDDRRQALRDAAPSRPDRHVLQQDPARSGRHDSSRDTRRT